MPRLTRDQRVENLRTAIAKLQTENARMEAQIAEMRSKLKFVLLPSVDSYLTAFSHDPTTTVREHIRLLHEYNEIKDVAQGLMTMIAEDRGVCLDTVYKDFGVDGMDD
ncbi:Swi5-domain-containing protein [Penicillium capsulatum]|uniref:Swi5-domain-containing protein n=1 Tax=Penicillium capsulatum TaxID=69766 RepID=A0A9W9LWB8_9EURO|nr:Swi5-domain-containing protein [Penicillium capsulatum]KAJ6122619.1 Swi5-domain-containing protein [Penicillium capsulatum]